MPRINVTPHYENTTEQVCYHDITNELLGYFIAPVDGYVLHDNGWDLDYIDAGTGEHIFKLGYAEGSVSVWHNYDFEANPRELYAVLRSTVPEDQIYGDNGEEII